jgi:outer membrane lipoprotein-sorting protein
MALALTFIFTAPAVIETKAQGAVNEVLKRMDDHYKVLKSLRTDTTMVKYDSVVQASDTMRGKAMFLPLKGKNALVRIDWTKPEESLAVVDKQYVIYRPRLKQAIVGNVDSAKGTAGANSPLAFINMSKEQLKANYNIKYLGEEKVGGTIPTWHLELTPKAAAKYKLAEIWVDGNGMPIQMKIIETNNDSTQVLLSNIEKNISLKTDVFKINLPKDTKIVKGGS